MAHGQQMVYTKPPCSHHWQSITCASIAPRFVSQYKKNQWLVSVGRGWHFQSQCLLQTAYQPRFLRGQKRWKLPTDNQSCDYGWKNLHHLSYSPHDQWFPSLHLHPFLRSTWLAGNMTCTDGKQTVTPLLDTWNWCSMPGYKPWHLKVSDICREVWCVHRKIHLMLIHQS